MRGFGLFTTKKGSFMTLSVFINKKFLMMKTVKAVKGGNKK